MLNLIFYYDVQVVVG